MWPKSRPPFVDNQNIGNEDYNNVDNEEDAYQIQFSRRPEKIPAAELAKLKYCLKLYGGNQALHN